MEEQMDIIKEASFLTPHKFSHCSSICPVGDGILITFYSSTIGECRDDQRVRLQYYENSKYAEYKELKHRTGNPVIWSESENKAILLYSYFEDLTTNRMVDRWKHCTNWLLPINVDAFVGAGHLPEPIQLKTEPEQGFLGRCQPIRYNEEWLLPIYDENIWYSEIWRGNGTSFTKMADIGRTRRMMRKGGMIQSTVWHDENNKLYSLSRDGTKGRKAWYSESEDGTKWSNPIPVDITNYNNSIVAIHNPNKPTAEPYVIWNQTNNYQGGSARGNLMFGKLERTNAGLTAKPITKLNESRSGSYPNYCFDNKNNLHLIFTDYPGIKHIIMDAEKLYE
jgi:predicted neuraminidase